MNLKMIDSEVLEYLDRAIDCWRIKRDKASRDSNTTDYDRAVDYVDAFQSVRTSLFGELKPL